MCVCSRCVIRHVYTEHNMNMNNYKTLYSLHHNIYFLYAGCCKYWILSPRSWPHLPKIIQKEAKKHFIKHDDHVGYLNWTIHKCITTCISYLKWGSTDSNLKKFCKNSGRKKITFLGILWKMHIERSRKYSGLLKKLVLLIKSRLIIKHSVVPVGQNLNEQLSWCAYLFICMLIQLKCYIAQVFIS